MTSTTTFRADVGEWFAEHTPTGWREAVAAMSVREWEDFHGRWLRTLNTRGFAAPHVPKEWGGGGYSLAEHVVILEEWAAADGPGVDLFEISLFHLPGTLLAAGSPEQRERYLRQGIDGVVWCQGFSEPGAGSDLAALRTTAVPDGDGWRLHGQKIWSSHAQHARFCLLLARTDPDAARHHGITYFILDLDQPGVDIRPIRQAAGLDVFCEIFLDGAYVGPDDVIGSVNSGWRVAQSTLDTERGILGLEVIERLGHQLRAVAAALTDDAAAGGVVTADQATLAGYVARHAAVRALAAHGIDLLEAGDRSGGVPSLMKVAFSELIQQASGWRLTLDPEASLVDPQPGHFAGYVTPDAQLDWVQSWGWTIAGGSNEIQRNIIAERLLGLPREPRPAR